MKLLYILLLIISATNLHFAKCMTGGEFREIKQVPYMAQVELKYKQGFTSFCGATIISEHWLVTAAHCVGILGGVRYQVRVGTSTTTSKGIVLKIEKVVVHGDYDDETITNDIALVKVAEPITFNEFVQPIPLAKVEPKVGDVVTISGFGDSFNGMPVYVLKVGEASVIARDVCKLSYKILTENMLCTSVEKIDICFGDSGTSSVFNGQLVGVASQGCEHPKPNVFSNVANYRDWIINVTAIQYTN